MKALLLALLSLSLVLSMDADLDRYLTQQAISWKKTPIKAQWLEERFGKYYQPAGLWNVHLKEGVDVDEFARSLDMEVVQHLASLGNIYVLRPTQNETNTHLKREEVARAVHARLEARGDRTQWFEEDYIRTYDKYQSDPRFGNQWHLENGQTPGADANVKAAWKLGVTGASVQIAIVDDSFQTTHPDLAPGYVAADSFNFNNNNNNPNPVATEDNHGTSCAGVAGARDDGVTCGVGAAYRAKLAGVRTIGGPISDAGIASALTYKNQNSDIYSCSWGIPDCNLQGNTALCQIVPISRVKQQALERGTTEGRGGKGSIFLFAAGNYRLYGSNTNNQDFCTQRQVIAVAASTNRGGVSYYSTAGAGLLVAAPSSGDGRLGELGITTSDRVGANLGYDPASDCTNGFGGTSSATPLVAGIVALMLDKNPSLTWRDVQDILVHTTTKIKPDDPGWQTNGAGLHVSHDFGFGNVDAEAAVNAADERTIHLTCDKSATSQKTTANLAIPDNSATGVESTMSVSGVTEIVSLESMRITVNIQHTARGDLQIILVSPSGTQSILAEPRNDPAPNYVNWNFKTNFNWDESPNGKWTLKVVDRAAADAGTLNDWSMTFYGKCPGEEQPSKKLSSKAVAGVVIGVIVGGVVVLGVIIFVIVRKKQGKSVIPFKG